MEIEYEVCKQIIKKTTRYSRLSQHMDILFVVAHKKILELAKCCPPQKK